MKYNLNPPHLRSVPHYLQQDSRNCGPCCLQMIFAYYRSHVSVAQLGEEAAQTCDGTSMFGLMRAAERHGFLSRALQGSAEELYQKIQAGQIPLPCIARVFTDINGSTFDHYIVITGLSSKNIRYNDPAHSKKKVESRSFFAERFQGQILVLEPSDTFKPETQTVSTAKILTSLLNDRKGSVLLLLLFSLAITVISLGAAYLVKLVVDNITSNAGLNIHWATNMVVIMGTAYLLRYLLQTLRAHCLLKVSENLKTSLLSGYLANLLQLRLRSLERFQRGELHARLYDSQTVQNAITTGFPSLVLNSITGIGALSLLLCFSHQMFLIALVMLIIFASISLLYANPMKQQQLGITAANDRMLSYFNEVIQNIPGIQAISAQGSALNAFETLIQDFLLKTRRAGLTFVRKDGLIELVTSFGALVLLIVGGAAVTDGNITIGTLMLSISLAEMSFDAVSALLSLQAEMQELGISASRLFDLRHLETEGGTDGEQLPFQGAASIVLDGVTYRYGTSVQPALDRVSCKIPTGSHTAILGRSGSGKSTLCRLLINAYEPEMGRIQIGEQLIGDIDLTDLRKHVCYLSQNPVLIGQTLRSAILFGTDRIVSDEELFEALSICCGQHFVQKLPFGLDSSIADNLSTGQRQILQLTKAMLNNDCCTLILDEATSAIDPLTTATIMENIKHSRPDLTLILVTHRLNETLRCENILVMDQGRIIESGDPQTLLSQNGLYANLLDVARRCA